jgi:hypothetical protein
MTTSSCNFRDQGLYHLVKRVDQSAWGEVRSRGTLQHDRARVAARQIAGPRLVAVYPVTGWWEDSTTTWERRLPYSVIVSVDLGNVDVDLTTGRRPHKNKGHRHRFVYGSMDR